nr:hypothetical protein [uncultured bacterium]
MALRRNKVRTALTVLGIVIGISAVITVMSAGQGIKGFIVQQVETFGTDIIEVEIKVPSTSHTSTENAMGQATGIEITTLKLEDDEAIRKLPNIKNSYAGVMGQQLVSAEGENKQIVLFGVSASFNEIDKTKLAAGRFFTDEEDKSLANVAVIGPKVKEKIFGDNDFLDQWIKVGHQKFKVIGLMESRGASFGFDMDEMIFVPVRTLQKKIMGIDHLTFIMAQVYDTNIMDQTAAEMTDLMRQQHNITDPDKDDFAVMSMTEALEMLDAVFWAITLLLMAVAGISLVVGGVGIMNIMYVSVLERTYEVGLRKAMGAKRINILLQFLWEAIIITFLGAVFGVIFGIVLSWLIAIVANAQGFPWRFVILPSSLLLASSVAGLIGLLFGVFPARTAANMDPVEALRYNR